MTPNRFLQLPLASSALLLAALSVSGACGDSSSGPAGVAAGGTGASGGGIAMGGGAAMSTSTGASGGQGGTGSSGGAGGVDTSLFGARVVATVTHGVADGVLVAGHVVDDGSGVGEDIFVGKVDEQGAVVTGFGTAGSVRLDLGGTDPAFNEAALAIDVTSDGKLVVAGASRAIDSNTTNGPLFVMRLNADGSPDPTFADNGIYQADYGSEVGIRGVTIDDSGRVLIAGYHDIGGDDFLVARLLTDGTVDTSFGSFSTPGRTVIEGTHRAAAVFPDGDDLVVGGFQDFVITKITEDGTPVAAFGTNGRNQYSGGGRATQLLKTSGGKYVMAGFEEVPNQRTVLVGYDADGQLDAAFGSAGVVNFPASSPAEPVGLVERQGNIYVMVGPGQVARLSLAGVIDVAFGNSGPIKLVAPNFVAIDARDVGRNQLATRLGGVGLVGKDAVTGSADFVVLDL